MISPPIFDVCEGRRASGGGFKVLVCITFFTRDILPRHLLCRYEDVLAAGAVVVHPSARQVVVGQHQAPIRPALSCFGRTPMPCLHRENSNVTNRGVYEKSGRRE